MSQHFYMTVNSEITRYADISVAGLPNLEWLQLRPFSSGRGLSTSASCFGKKNVYEGVFKGILLVVSLHSIVMEWFISHLLCSSQFYF